MHAADRALPEKRPSIAKAKRIEKGIPQATPAIIQIFHSLPCPLPLFLSPSQPQGVLRRLSVPSDPLTARQVFILDILLLALPLVSVASGVLYPLGSFAGWLSDLASDLAHGGLESCLETAAYGVADVVEEACLEGEGC